MTLLFPSDDDVPRIIWCDPPPDPPFPHVETLKHPRYGHAHDVWVKRNAARVPIGGQARFVDETGAKQDRMFRWGRLGTFNGWICRTGPKPWQIFGLDELARRPHAAVLVCEGPKARAAAADRFPGLVAVCASGALMAKHYDWVALRGRAVTIWPDNDDAGSRFARDVGLILCALNGGHDIVQLPAHMAKGWDLADVPNGYDLDELYETRIPMTTTDYDPSDVDAMAEEYMLPADVVEDTDETDYADLGIQFLPDEFWNAMPVLQQIRSWCWTHRYPADSTLLCAMTRIAAMLPGTAVIKTGIGMPAPPILFGLVLADSGGFKSVSQYAAQCLVPKPEGLSLADGAEPGSGEGFEGAYCKCSKDGDWEQVRHNAWFSIDEGEIIDVLKKRSVSSTWGSKLRKLYTGQRMFTQLSRSQRLVVGYSAGLMANMQFETMASMLREDKLGTPGRFIFCSAGDPSMPEERMSHYAMPVFRWYPPAEIKVAPEIAAEIDRGGWERVTLQSDAPVMDGHRTLNRVRVAAILAVMRESDFVTVQDWDLAGVMMGVSDNVRRKAQIKIEQLKDDEEADEIRKTIRQLCVSRTASDTGVADSPMAKNIGTVARRCYTMAKQGKKMTRRDAHKALKKDYINLASVLTACLQLAFIVEDEPGVYSPGPKVPPPPGKSIIITERGQSPDGRLQYENPRW